MLQIFVHPVDLLSSQLEPVKLHKHLTTGPPSTINVPVP